MKQKYFYLWRRWLLDRQKAKAEKACKKKAEDVCLDMATRYETKIKKVKINRKFYWLEKIFNNEFYSQKMEEDRLKIQDELRLSRLENEKYRIDLAKSEENMRKALMRGVCALNLEAMSIFNENLVHPVPPPPSSFIPPTPLQPQHQQPQSKPTAKPSTSISNSSTRPDPSLLTRSLPKKLITSNGHVASREREHDVLARKVKQFCEVNFDNHSKASMSSQRKSSLEPQISADEVVAVAANEVANKFKLKVLDDNTVNNFSVPKIPPGRYSENFKLANEPSSVKIHSNSKTFDELVEHSLNIPVFKMITFISLVLNEFN